MRPGSAAGKSETELEAALQRFAGRAPSAFLPDDQEAVDRALLAGKSLAEVAPNSPLRHAFTELAAAAEGRPAQRTAVRERLRPVADERRGLGWPRRGSRRLG